MPFPLHGASREPVSFLASPLAGASLGAGLGAGSGRRGAALPSLRYQSAVCNTRAPTLCCLFLRSRQNLVGAGIRGIWRESLREHPVKAGSGKWVGERGRREAVLVLPEPSPLAAASGKRRGDAARWGAPGELLCGLVSGFVQCHASR